MAVTCGTDEIDECRAHIAEQFGAALDEVDFVHNADLPIDQKELGVGPDVYHIFHD